MPQQQQQSPPTRSSIPNCNCPRCHTGMRLALVEPAAMSIFRVETLVFECTCGYTCKLPYDNHHAAG